MRFTRPIHSCITLAFILYLLVGPASLRARYLEDFDRNGSVNVTDVLALLHRALENAQDPALDFDGDGRYSIRDAIALLVNITGGKISEVADLPGDAAHRELSAGEIPVRGPGSYAQEGATYVLTRDISSPRSAIFLGNNVTLDLNGYTLGYADTLYEHVPNYGFEEGLAGWDLTNAPGALVQETAQVQTFIGEKILSLPSGQEIASAYIDLPVANRAYYAMCGVARQEMAVTINVDDEQGKPVYCQFVFGTNIRQTCPEVARSPMLGGGFVFALLHGLPAGRYRIRVKAENSNCLIDEVDIRPALDVGVGVVGSTYPWAYYKSIIDGDYTAFFDYTEPGTWSTPLPDIPQVSGSGTVTVRNGVIRSGALGVRSWGLQSTAEEVGIVLDNVRFEAAGINTNAVDVPQAVITNCRFELDSPFIINRHRVGDQPVYLRGDRPAEVANCQFIGGQGCLTLGADNSLVHDNLFVNDQMVTNHYSINVGGRGIRIFNNRFEPRTGSGILIGGSDGIEVYGNVFRISTSPPTCEYGFEEYSVNAVRITDYNRAPGEEGTAKNNRVHDNEIYITARDYPERRSYIPLVNADFLSVGGGTNYFYANKVVIEHLDPLSKAVASAFYVGGSDNGGQWYGNTVTSNVTPVWIATTYGSASQAIISGNTFIKADNASENYATARLGYWSAEADNIEFRSNTCEGADFSVETAEGNQSYKVYWTLTVRLNDSAGQPVASAEVVVNDRTGAEVLRKNTDTEGKVSAELLEYEFSAGAKSYSSPYTVKAVGLEKSVTLDRNLEITLP